MPIIKSTNVTHILKTLSFNSDGSLDVSFSVQVGAEALPDKCFHISMQESHPIIDVALSAPAATIRQGVIQGVYMYAVNNGLIDGTIQ